MIDFEEIDKVIHEKARLSIVSLLATREEWSFGDLRDQLSMTDGNLITHLRTLAKAGFVSSTRETGQGRPRSIYQLTAEGKSAFQKYLTLLEQIVAAGKPIAHAENETAPSADQMPATS